MNIHRIEGDFSDGETNSHNNNGNGFMGVVEVTQYLISDACV